jgi:hypothetical protein
MVDPTIPPRQQVPTAELVKEALDQARVLVRSEVALAREEIKSEVTKARTAAIGIGAAVGLAMLGIAFLLIAFAIVTVHHPIVPFLFGIGALVLAGVLVAVAIAALPKKPLDHTRERVETDVQVLKERIA